MQIINIEDVLSPSYFNAIYNSAKTGHYTPLDRGDESSIYIGRCSSLFVNKVLERVRESVGEVELITSYFRYNDPETDAHLRVHSDRDIENQQPDYGCIYYIDNKDGGTGLFDHKVYGAELPDGVDQPETEYGDESLWTLREVLEGKDNSLNLYPARCFHSRYPIKSTHDRLVLVMFLKKKES